jgi:NDP-sugar pyrophosphorylase family protein
LLEIDLLPELVAVGRVRGHRSDGFFLDIGLPETYEQVQRAVLAWWTG